MRVKRGLVWCVTVLTLFSPRAAICAVETFRVATYNLENYIDEPNATRPQPKSSIARAKIRQCSRGLTPDVLALQEMGSLGALQELRASLKSEGLEFPFWELVSGVDTNIHIAVLSRLPIVARRPHTNDTFLVGRRRASVSRGFAEVDIEVNPACKFTLLVAHLKSLRPVPVGDEADLRLEEARILRGIINDRLTTATDANLVVCGDFNDTQDSAPLKEIIGRGKLKLVDTRPAERSADSLSPPNAIPDLRNVTWTYHFSKNDTFSRVDYMLLSPGMSRSWVTNETFVLALPDWGLASDHRPLAATFRAGSR